ncbi:unnamed protein product [Adineta ricciae]|uniref:Uncharacterized protein n=1 Tax=Adineta ricciae TaxID=249248 RepID=A0A814VBU5_ADIRI|nr:unnamed protein product [Adineta ricciae]CAF1393538.1 unnamed protein product [Adineta ricciae]
MVHFITIWKNNERNKTNNGLFQERIRKELPASSLRTYVQENEIADQLFNVVTKREIVNEDEIQKSADQFVSEVKSLLPYYNEDFILNTDQAGPQLEFPSTRTLSYQREKTTLATVRSVNAITHSYTVQTTITMSGKILGPVYICLKEVIGRMSDNIKANLQQLKNVVVKCSASGKLTT